jgi:hypothetical protein
VLGQGGILADDDRMHSSAQITKVRQALLRRRVEIYSYNNHCSAPFSRACWLALAPPTLPGVGADIVMESIALIYPIRPIPDGCYSFDFDIESVSCSGS